MSNFIHKLCLFVLMSMLLMGCGFHLRGDMKLAPPLHRLYLQTPDPYGSLARSLQSYLKMSGVFIVGREQDAQTILVIMQDNTSEELLSVSSTQQTRQYNLHAVVVFEITDRAGRVILPPQQLRETRAITVQSNQILGHSNESNLYFQQMRRSLAFAIMNRLSSKQVNDVIVHYFKGDKNAHET